MSSQGSVRIGELARRTGVSPELLRAWEQRYGLLRPARSQGGFRLYTDEDEQRVRAMRAFIGQGLSAAEAASRALTNEPGWSATRGPAVADIGLELRNALDAFDSELAHDALDRLLASVSIETALAEVSSPTSRARRSMVCRRSQRGPGALRVQPHPWASAGSPHAIGRGGRLPRRPRVPTGRRTRPRLDHVRARRLETRPPDRVPRCGHSDRDDRRCGRGHSSRGGRACNEPGRSHCAPIARNFVASPLTCTCSYAEQERPPTMWRRWVATSSRADRSRRRWRSPRSLRAPRVRHTRERRTRVSDTSRDVLGSLRRERDRMVARRRPRDPMAGHK